jgi:hypothetical protein
MAYEIDATPQNPKTPKPQNPFEMKNSFLKTSIFK